jgi:hypothetical protein
VTSDDVAGGESLETLEKSRPIRRGRGVCVCDDGRVLADVTSRRRDQRSQRSIAAFIAAAAGPPSIGPAHFISAAGWTDGRCPHDPAF